MNTFGEYQFEKWVPQDVREMIRNFWGQMGRTHKDWLKSPSEQGVREYCHHGPNPNGFGMPPNGATAFFFFYRSGKAYDMVKGRYIHLWNNMGSLIDDEGNRHSVSTCDMWVRFYQSGEKKSL